jgi:hypothetical protein
MPEFARGPAAVRVVHSLGGAVDAPTGSFIGSKIGQHSQIITGTVCTILGSRLGRWAPSRRGLTGKVHAGELSRPTPHRSGSGVRCRRDPSAIGEVTRPCQRSVVSGLGRPRERQPAQPGRARPDAREQLREFHREQPRESSVLRDWDVP